MRTELYNYIDGLSKGTFSLAAELPWSSSGQPLYQSNYKRIYVDRDQYTTEAVIAMMNGSTIDNEITTVRVYFTTDAKQLPSNYDALVALIRDGKDIASANDYFKRECDVATNFEADSMVTEFEFRFTKII